MSPFQKLTGKKRLSVPTNVLKLKENRNVSGRHRRLSGQKRAPTSVVSSAAIITWPYYAIFENGTFSGNGTQRTEKSKFVREMKS